MFPKGVKVACFDRLVDVYHFRGDNLVRGAGEGRSRGVGSEWRRRAAKLVLGVGEGMAYGSFCNGRI
jgi:hypothetical protein